MVSTRTEPWDCSDRSQSALMEEQSKKADITHSLSHPPFLLLPRFPDLLHSFWAQRVKSSLTPSGGTFDPSVESIKQGDIRESTGLVDISDAFSHTMRAFNGEDKEDCVDAEWDADPPRGVSGEMLARSSISHLGRGVLDTIAEHWLMIFLLGLFNIIHNEPISIGPPPNLAPRFNKSVILPQNLAVETASKQTP